MTWTIREVLKWTTQKFQSQGFDTPLLESQLILQDTLQVELIHLYTQWDKPLTLSEREQIRIKIQRRLKNEPMAYILGYKYWHDLKLQVDSRVLIPRPETETLLDWTLQLMKNANVKSVVDLCTGSGCLAIALAKAFPQATVIAIDNSPDALAVAKTNADLNNTNNIEFLMADVCDGSLYTSIVKKYGSIDIVISNPPYVSEEEWNACHPTVKDFEPKAALVCASQGLHVGQCIVNNVLKTDFLSAFGLMAIELGAEQPQKIIQKDIGIFSTQTPNFKLPKGVPFALRDWEDRVRYLCYASGQLDIV